MVNEITFEVSGQSVQMDVEDALRFVGIAVHVGSNGYARVDRKDWSGDRYVHRFIMGAKKGQYVDHINGNKLDNRRVNLRICTNSENNCNVPRKKHNTSGVTGVSWDEKRMKWIAQITKDGKCRSLGRFVNFDDAVRARKEAEIRLHGEFVPKGRS